MDGVAEVSLQSSVKGSGAGTAPGGSSGVGGCSSNDAVFQMTVNFDPLPSATASAAAAESKSSPVADSSATSPATGGKTG